MQAMDALDLSPSLSRMKWPNDTSEDSPFTFVIKRTGPSGRVKERPKAGLGRSLSDCL